MKENRAGRIHTLPAGVPQPLAYPDMLEHRSPEGTAIFTLGVDAVPGNWRKKLC